jgi:HAD superfamily hydrolase (TIGR01484 family)
MQCPRAAIFDLDETLAVSFQPPTPEMLARLTQLLSVLPVTIMTGAGFERLEEQFLPGIPRPSAEQLIFFTNSSTQCYIFCNGSWHLEYDLTLTEEERAKIKSAIRETIEEMDILKNAPHFGEQIVDRKAQIAFTSVGVDAPADLKKSWDPDGAKRRIICEVLKKKIPGYNILIGGASTIDVTRKDVDKAYGVEWYSKYMNIPIADMLYVGDALYEGGNDSVVIPTGIQTRQVSGPGETEKIIDELLLACAT